MATSVRKNVKNNIVETTPINNESLFVSLLFRQAAEDTFVILLFFGDILISPRTPKMIHGFCKLWVYRPRASSDTNHQK